MKKIIVILVAITAMHSCKKHCEFETKTVRVQVSIDRYPLPIGCTSNLGYSSVTGKPCGDTSSQIIVSQNEVTHMNPLISGVFTAAEGRGDIVDFAVPFDYAFETAVSAERCIVQAKLYVDNMLIASASPQHGVLEFHNLGIHLNESQTKRFCVMVDIKPYTNNYPIPTLLRPYIESNGIQAFDTHGHPVEITVIDNPEREPLQLVKEKVVENTKLVVSLSNSTLKAQTVKVSNTTTTNSVELFTFSFKAEGGKLHSKQIPILLQTSHTNLSDVANNLTLKLTGSTSSTVFNESVVSATPSSPIIFDDIEVDAQEGEVITGTIYVDINSIQHFPEGTTLSASIPNSYVLATSGVHIDAEDINGDQIPTERRSGSAIGEVMTFRTVGVNVVMGTPSYNRTTDALGDVTSVTYSIPVSITSFGNTLYLGQTLELASVVSSTYALAYVYQQSGAPSMSDTSSKGSATIVSTDAIVEGNGFRIDDAQTKHFTLTITLTDPSQTNTNYRIQLKQIKIWTNAMLTQGGQSIDLVPIEKYRTDYQFINN